MADHRSRARRLLLVTAATVVAFAACGDDNCDDGVCVEESSARLLDLACGSGSEGSCEVSGDARETTGITADTVGYRLGDGGGTVIIPIDAIGTSTVLGNLQVQVLVASSVEGARSELSAKLTWGSCTECPIDPPPFIGKVTHDYAWVTVATGQPNTGLGPATIPPDAALTLSGRELDIADLRTVVRSEQIGCAIAGPIGR